MLTRVFQLGNSQAVRIPKAFRFDVDEVEIFQRGEEIVLRARPKHLGEAFHLLISLQDDFMQLPREDEIPTKRNFF